MSKQADNGCRFIADPLLTIHPLDYGSFLPFSQSPTEIKKSF
jgi:hypothetical protein